MFSLARDGARDAVFNVYESLLVEPPPDAPITVSLLDNPSIKAQGKVREVTPAVAANTGMPVGAFGSAPQNWALHQFGPDTWGFEVESGFTNMGYSTQSTSFVVPRGSGFRDTGFMRSGISNLGSIPDCDDDKPCTSPKAFDIDFDITPDRTAAGAVWPLIVTESGPACGSQASAVHRVEFDDAAGVYRVPRILKRETCEDDWGED